MEEDELLETEIKFIEEKINKGLYEDKKFGEMFLLNINKSKVIDSLESIRLKLDSIRQEGSNRKIQFLVKDEPNIKLYTWDRKFVLSLFVIFGLFICFIHIIIYFLLFNLKKQ